MADFFLTKKAVADLSEIWNYTFDKWSEKQADLYYQMLLDNFRAIVNNPSMGKSYEGIFREICGYKAGRHIIFYRRLNANEVEITRILHEQMDIKNRIRD